MKPLIGLVVIEFSSLLSGSSAALRLADLGARVIKIEHPVHKDRNQESFVNRNKESYAANLENPNELEKVKKLIRQADVMIENLPLGSMEKLGLGYKDVAKINPSLVYGSISGYGKEGPWANEPEEDLHVQSCSGAAWLNGNHDQPPVPFGLAVSDLLAGAHLTQGILACLLRVGRSGRGGLVEVSKLESMLDFQFEVLTTFLNDGGKLPVRSSIRSAHAYLGAPYGIYETKDGYIAIAMGSVVKLGELIRCKELTAYTDSKEWFTRRDEIKGFLQLHLKNNTTQHWLTILEPADYWCADVFDWGKLLNHEGFKVLDMIQEVGCNRENTIKTTRCPIRVNGKRLKSP